MTLADATTLAWAGIGFIGAFAAWKAGVQAYRARRASYAQRALA